MKSSTSIDKTRDEHMVPGFADKTYHKEQDRSIRIIAGYLVSAFLAITMMVIIFRFSAANSVASSGLSQRLSRSLIEIFQKAVPISFSQDFFKSLVDLIEIPLRKAAHFSEYTILGFLMINHMLFVGRIRAVRKRGNISCRFYLLLSVGICVLYAASDEIHQYFVPGRACRFFDVCIDSLGVVFGTFLFWVIFRRLLDAIFGKGYNT